MVKVQGIVYLGNGGEEACVEGLKNPPFHPRFLNYFEKVIIEEVRKPSKELHMTSISSWRFVTLHLMDNIFEFI
jgi:hypothetical protein